MKEESIKVEGIIEQIMSPTDYRCRVGEHLVSVRRCGRLVKHHIRCTVGDKVALELSPYDPMKGRITQRL